MIEQILKTIDEEIATLQRARAILAGAGHRPARARAVSAPTRPKPRRLSAKARRAIAEAQRKRWAKVRSQKKAEAGGGAQG